MCQIDNSRFEMELQLLEAMYPEQITYDRRSGDLAFSDASGQLQLRIPELYPEAALPEVIFARNASRDDIRDRIKDEMRQLSLTEGEEALDAIMECFQRTATTTNDTNSPLADLANSLTSAEHTETNKTVIVWLHHLLALTKRKLALAPPASVSGVTKPGYPGIMIFTGNASAVDEHVNILKAENWQAFQVRYEQDTAWNVIHGNTVKEVETMAEVVKAVEVGEHGAKQKEEFLRAVGIK